MYSSMKVSLATVQEITVILFVGGFHSKGRIFTMVEDGLLILIDNRSKKRHTIIQTII